MTDPWDADSDDDGMSDGYEYWFTEWNLEENIWEIFNILSRTFESSLGSCVLEKIYYPGDDLPQTVSTTLRAGNGQVNRISMDVEVSGYDAGVLMALTT